MSKLFKSCLAIQLILTISVATTQNARQGSPKVGIFDGDERYFGLSKSKVDVFLRGYIRGISADADCVHSCFDKYEYIYYSVLTIEELYFEWMSDAMGVEGSYRIFKKVCQIYKYMEQVELGCFQRLYFKEFFRRISGGVTPKQGFSPFVNMKNFDAIY